MVLLLVKTRVISSARICTVYPLHTNKIRFLTRWRFVARSASPRLNKVMSEGESSERGIVSTLSLGRDLLSWRCGHVSLFLAVNLHRQRNHLFVVRKYGYIDCEYLAECC